MKPILACDVNLDKVKYPVMMLPKIDGVRGLNPEGGFVGRSGKQFKNLLNTATFSKEEFIGFDGEMVVERITGDGICNETTSALTTIKGKIPTRWCVFDFVIDCVNNNEPYAFRYETLRKLVSNLYDKNQAYKELIWVIPFRMAHHRQHIDAMESEALKMGFEGLILRDPQAGYKYGRCTENEANFLRLKRFMDAEMRICGVLEGSSNGNIKKSNPNGYAERATLKENMKPNGMIGTLCGHTLQDAIFSDRIIIPKGTYIEVGAGKMTHKQRKYFFENQAEIIGKCAKYQFFPIGIKDKPRFPTFQSFRSPIDL